LTRPHLDQVEGGGSANRQFVVPQIVEAILGGRQPTDLSAETLIKRIDLPLSWAEQKALLGLD